MKNAAVLRITGDVCLYFAFTALLRAFSGYIPLMAVFLLLAAAGLFLGVRMAGKALRILPALLPLLVFWRVRELYGIILFAPPAIYILLTAVLG